MTLNTRNNLITSLHPKVVGAFTRLNEKLIAGYQSGLSHSQFQFFEGYRSGERQDYLFTKGSTKARKFQSAHNFGLAGDFVAVKYHGDKLTWSWDINEDWQYLAKCADEVGLSAPISWDKPHVQSHIWEQIRKFVI